MTSLEACDFESLEMRRDNNFHQTSSDFRVDEENDCETPIRAMQSSKRLRKPPLDAARRGSALSFSLVGMVALFIISQTVLASSDGHSASHLLFRRQALAEGESEDATATTTPASATTTTESNVQPLLATEGTTTTPAPSTTTAAASTGNGRPTKIPPVNFTQVNQLFDAVFEESDVVARWRHMDKQLTDGEYLGEDLFP